MRTLLSILQEKCSEAILKSFDIPKDNAIAEVALCQDQNFGNYQCNSALKLVKILKLHPKDIAFKITENIDDNFKGEKIIEKMEVANPGFINITLSPEFLSKELDDMFKDPHIGVNIPKPQKIIVEFSSPNIAKQLHVGHLRSTIIGDCLARLFEFLGHDVLKLNHVGDWGTQFGMLIAFINEHEPDIFSGKAIDLLSLEELYKQAREQFDKDSDFRKRSQLEVVKLQGGDKNSLHGWKVICDISRKAYQEIYDLLDIKIIERGESYYNSILQNVVDELENKGLVEISEGAKCIFSDTLKNRENNPLPVMIQKSDGGFNYDTTDMAAMRQRVFEEKADRIIVVTASEQHLHFKLIYEACIKAKYLDPSKVQFDHVTFGLVLGADGKKFKTRSGHTEKLIDLIQGAIDEARRLLLKKEPGISMEELKELGLVLGIDAIKYADLSCQRLKDYQFSYDRMLKFEGNTAVFLLYSYVRVMGIKRRVIDLGKGINFAKMNLQQPAEISLGLHLRRFGEILEVMVKDLMPHRLADYLYDLACKFNIFFRDCKVIGSKEQDQRLALCELTAKIMKNGLDILGLKTTDKL